jgi:hypothetical protein
MGESYRMPNCLLTDSTKIWVQVAESGKIRIMWLVLFKTVRPRVRLLRGREYQRDWTCIPTAVDVITDSGMGGRADPHGSHPDRPADGR